jgi:hypothetical protein
LNITNTERAVKEAMNFALTAALKKSPRSGFGWVLLDGQGRYLDSNSMIIGADLLKLSMSVEKFALTFRHLVLTSDPVTAMIDQERLIQALASSECKTITIGFCSDVQRDTPWQQWLSTWKGKVYNLPHTQLTEMLSAGPNKVLLNGLPWLTSISTANLHGAPLKLIEFKNEFGFSAYIRELANQSSVILYTASQKDILECLDKKNFSEADQLICEVDSLPRLESILRYCAMEKRTSAVILCDIEFLQQLVCAGKCDEIVHHLGLISAEPADVLLQQWTIPFDLWSIITSDAIGKCLRLVLRRNKTDPITAPEYRVNNS